MKKIFSMVLVALMLFAFAACGGTVSTPSSTVSASPSTASDPSSAEEIAGSGVLFIGTLGNFKEIVLAEGADTSPDALIAAIAEETGWNLDLAEPVSVGKDGATVVFASSSAIFTGPPTEQKDDYHVFDNYGLFSFILDSVWQTLRYNSFTDPESADLDSYHVYYATEGDEAIKIPDSDLVIPVSEPYTGFENLATD